MTKGRVGVRGGWLVPAWILAGGVSGLAACGGGGGGSNPTNPPVPQTQTVSGSATSTAPGSCASDSHDFQVAAGTTVQVRLDASGDPALRMQVCADSIDNNDCTINSQVVQVGQSLSGVRKGSSTQNLKFLRLGCSGGATFVAGPTSYTATVNYSRP